MSRTLLLIFLCFSYCLEVVASSSVPTNVLSTKDSSANAKQWVFSGTANGWSKTLMIPSGNLFVTCQYFNELYSGFKIRDGSKDDWVEAYPPMNYEVKQNNSYDITFNPKTKQITATLKNERCIKTLSDASMNAETLQADVGSRHYVVEMAAWSKADETEYCPRLLKLILNASKLPDEVILFDFTTHHYAQAREVAEVQRNDSRNKVLCTATNKEREQVLRSIRVPIYKGLLGARALVIRKEDQEKFSRITHIDQLKLLRAGQGILWPDTLVMQDNKLTVVEGVSTESLYQMLKTKRIDYFPRGIFEVTYEGETIKKLDLTVDNNLLISYPMPMYFFVNKKNTDLAERIERGWKIIIKNGEFDKLFSNYPPVVNAIKELEKNKRHIIRLTNYQLPDKTPLDHTEYWFDISRYE